MKQLLIGVLRLWWVFCSLFAIEVFIKPERSKWLGALYLILFCLIVLWLLLGLAADVEDGELMNCHNCGAVHKKHELSFVRCGISSCHVCAKCLPDFLNPGK